MAWNELDASGNYFVCFRFGNKRFKRSLKTGDKQEADDLMRALERTIRDVERGRLAIPENADIVTFLLSDGRADVRPIVADAVTLKSLFDAYFAGIPEGSLEQSTIAGMKIHRNHLERHFGPSFAIRSASIEQLQGYVASRKVSGATSKKEIVTLRTVWNWGVAAKLVQGPFPGRGLKYSSAQWVKEAAPAVKTVCFDDPNAILNELPGLDAECDYVVADGPGSQSETSRALLLRAHRAIVPCKASILEVRALSKATEALRQAQDIRAGQPDAKIVLSMVGKNYRLTHDMKDAAKSLGLPMAHTALILRQIYADAPGQGAVVSKLGSRAREAANEIDALFRELVPEACKSTARKAKHG